MTREEKQKTGNDVENERVEDLSTEQMVKALKAHNKVYRKLQEIITLCSKGFKAGKGASAPRQGTGLITQSVTSQG